MASLIPRATLLETLRDERSSRARRDAARDALRGMRTIDVDINESIIGDRTMNGNRRNHRNRDRLARHMNDHAYIIASRSRVAITRDGTLHVTATLAALTAYREKRASMKGR